MRPISAKTWRALKVALSVGSVALSPVVAEAQPKAEAKAPPEPAGTLASGTRWATDYYDFTAPVPGPTVMVVAGVHGNETAPPLAAHALLTCPLEKGRLVVVPEANRPALSKGSRRSPKTRHSDLNRNFPKADGDAPSGAMAKAMWAFVHALKPDYLVDLHEGFDFRLRNRRSVGNSVIYGGPDTAAEAHWIVDSMNDHLELDYRRFVVLRTPILGSLARAASDRLDAHAFIFETTRRDQSLSARAAQHLLMLDLLFESIGVRSSACELPTSDAPAIARGPVQPAPASP